MGVMKDHETLRQGVIGLDDPAAAALGDIAAQLTVAVEELARAAALVRLGWLGPHRRRFDAERADHDARFASLIETCRRLARA